MEAFLNHNGHKYHIPPGDLVRIGKMEPCDIRLLDDDSVSRRHCSVSYLDGVLSVIDLGSTHGTFVNGLEVRRHPVSLSDGDVLQAGSVLLFVQLSEEARDVRSVVPDTGSETRISRLKKVFSKRSRRAAIAESRRQ